VSRLRTRTNFSCLQIGLALIRIRQPIRSASGVEGVAFTLPPGNPGNPGKAGS
jgi:hypothetical protein